MILYFMALGIGAIIITGVFSFITARKALMERTYDQLTSIRLSRKIQVERFFADRLQETAYFASLKDVREQAEKIFAGHFNETNLLMTNNTGSLLTSGYFSGFLIIDKSGRVLYENNSDSSINSIGTNAYNQIVDTNQQAPYIVDYSPNADSTGSILLSVYKIYIPVKADIYLALIVRTGRMDDFMLEVNPANGLGYSGETYMVGPDYLMRSQSRFISNSIMSVMAKTIPVINALNKADGIDLVKDYRGVKVLSSYGPVNIPGLNWAILAEIDYNEATASVFAIRNNILMLTVFMGLAFFIITYVISRKITKPIIRLKNAAVDLGEGRQYKMVGVESQDEIGELTEAFNMMAVRLHEKDEVLKMERLSRLKSAIDGQDQERQRLSRELHDGIGQSMIAIRLRLGALENVVNDKLKPNLETVISLTDNLIDEVRAISNALMPPALAEFGLNSAIHNLCNNLFETNGIKTSFEGDMHWQMPGAKARLYIFRIFQEVLNNAARHSEATSLQITSLLNDNTLIFSITDNGIGFDQQSPCSSKGHGLNNIRERANLLKGQASITSAPGAGTTIVIEVPIKKTTP